MDIRTLVIIQEMNTTKTNKTVYLLILFQLISIFTLLFSACGETNNKKTEMENKSKLTTHDTDSNHPGNPSSYDTITLGGGCFWCVEAVYEMLD